MVTVNFTPGNDGGATITGYTATCGSQTAVGTASSLTVTGLNNGTPYNCSVTATNSAGTGPASGLSNSGDILFRQFRAKSYCFAMSLLS